MNGIGFDLGLYILDENGTPKKISDEIKWGKWFKDSQSERIIAQTIVGGVRVSTVFLGMDHALGDIKYCQTSTPILYETMFFGGAEDQEHFRWSTKEEALVGHEKIVKQLS